MFKGIIRCRKKKEVFCKQVQGDVYDLAKTAYKPGHTELVKFLVEEQSIDVNHVVSDAGMTLFLCACVSGQKRLVNFMLDRGANIHSKTSDGDSALYLATFAITNSDRMDITLIELLIKAGCDVNGQNYNGNTALHRAAMKGNPVLIKTLLDYDADPYISNNELILPIDCAINAGHIGVAQILKINIISENDEDGDSPYTPTRIKLGLQSPPYKNHLVESTFHHKKVILS
ncbi:ankyrin repeat domain-containing protein 22-like [Saccoglossus kowalevskii]